MSFAVVMEGMTLIAFGVMISGGKQIRESGWKIITGLLIFVGLIQCTAMALVVSLPTPIAMLVAVASRFWGSAYGTRESDMKWLSGLTVF